MDILVIHDAAEIKAWLCGAAIEEAPEHIANGFPELLEGWANQTVTAEIVTVPEEKCFRDDLYEVYEGSVRRKS